MDVIKIGGAAGIDFDSVIADAAALVAAGRPLVLVHGGSDESTRLGERLGRPPRFVTSESGHVSRRTDRETLDVFLMATGLLNRRLVAGLRAAGVDAIGLSGVDGGVLRARRKAAIRVIENGRRLVLRDEWTGTPTGARDDFLRDLVHRGMTPVIAPVAISDVGEPLNVDGDQVVGNRVRAKVVKNKIAPPFRLTEFDVLYSQGISKEGDLIDLAVDAGVVARQGAWYSHGKMRLGQGRERARNFLIDNPDLADELARNIGSKVFPPAEGQPASETPSDAKPDAPEAKAELTPKAPAKKEPVKAGK